MRLIIALPALALLPACTAGTETCAALPGGGYCLQPAADVTTFAVEQEVTVRRGEEPVQRFIVNIEATARELRYAMLTPLGQLVLAGHADALGAEARGTAARRVPAALPPALIQTALWPEAAVRAGLTSGLSLRESGNARTFTAEDGRVMMEIRREGDTVPYRSLTISLPESVTEIRVTAIREANDIKSPQQ
jgi:hypothetical protein